MRRLIVLVVLAAALVLGRPPSLAGACSCAESTPAEEVARAEVVFTGTVVASRPVPADDPSGAGNLDHTVEVDRVYKGDVAAEVIVMGVEDTSSCGYAFAPGRYLVYGSQEDGERINTSLCSATTALPTGSPVPAELGEGRAPTPPPHDGDGDEGTASQATPTTWPPIGGPEGDVIEPSTWDTFGPVLVGAGGVVALAALGLVLLARRRSPT
ncbi:MAG TPA: hypothetical protein VEW93_15180 [Acidimicrobiales bacterium]|nr:hypothetical protein [Acidimicrobiales bacterium]